MIARRAAVVLVHGLGGTSATMAPLAALLEQRGIRCRVITLPGHGGVPDDLRHTRWQDWLDAVVAAVVEADDGGGVVLVGQSLGGALALAGASTTAAHLRGVVAINVPAPDPDAVEGLEWRLSRGHDRIDAVLADGEVGYATIPIVAVLEMAVNLLRIDLTAITVPITLINGALDEVVDPASADVLAAALTTGALAGEVRRVRLSRSGHVATLGPEGPTIADEVERRVTGVGSPG